MKKIFTLFISIGILISVKAQDIHFSQFYASPLTLNPANVGMFNGNIRGVLNYRSQWSSFAPFNTFAGSVDMNFGQNMLKDDLFGFGVNFFSDKAGDADFSTQQVNVSFGYIKTMGKRFSRSYLSVGFQGGIAQRSLNYAALTFGSQYNGYEYDPSMPNGETIGFDSFSFLDLSGGISYLFVPKDRFNLLMGLAFYHVNTPNMSFSGSDKDNLFMKISGNIGAQIPVADAIDIIPSVLVLNQGPHNEYNFGVSFKYYLNDKNVNPTSFSLGAMQRMGNSSGGLNSDATIITARFDYLGFSAGLSYDINVSNLRNASNSFGGPELSIVYTSPLPHRDRKVDCPRF